MRSVPALLLVLGPLVLGSITGVRAAISGEEGTAKATAEVVNWALTKGDGWRPAEDDVMRCDGFLQKLSEDELKGVASSEGVSALPPRLRGPLRRVVDSVGWSRVLGGCVPRPCEAGLLLTSQDGDEKGQAVLRISSGATSPAFPAILERLSMSPDPSLRAGAGLLATLGWRFNGPSEGLRSLVKRLVADDDPDVAGAICYKVAVALGDRDVFGFMVGRLTDARPLSGKPLLIGRGPGETVGESIQRTIVDQEWHRRRKQGLTGGAGGDPPAAMKFTGVECDEWWKRHGPTWTGTPADAGWRSTGDGVVELNVGERVAITVDGEPRDLILREFGTRVQEGHPQVTFSVWVVPPGGSEHEYPELDGGTRDRLLGRSVYSVVNDTHLELLACPGVDGKARIRWWTWMPPKAE